MITRIRIEAEGPSAADVERQLELAHEVFTASGPLSPRTHSLLFGELTPEGAHPALADAVLGDAVIERFARDTNGQAGDGGVVYRGRMTVHYAKPALVRSLKERLQARPLELPTAGVPHISSGSWVVTGSPEVAVAPVAAEAEYAPVTPLRPTPVSGSSSVAMTLHDFLDERCRVCGIAQSDAKCDEDGWARCPGAPGA